MQVFYVQVEQRGGEGEGEGGRAVTMTRGWMKRA